MQHLLPVFNEAGLGRAPFPGAVQIDDEHLVEAPGMATHPATGAGAAQPPPGRAERGTNVESAAGAVKDSMPEKGLRVIPR